MFTAARMVAALCMTVLAWLGVDYVTGLVPDKESFGPLPYVAMAIGFLCGWIIIGPRAGRGGAAAISHGLTGVVAAIFWVMLAVSVDEMVDLAMRHRYNGALDAFGAIFEIAVDEGKILLDTGFFMMMAIGAIVVGILPEIASRHWR